MVTREAVYTYAGALGACDRLLGLLLAGAALPAVAGAALAIRILSGRSPVVAHLRVGQHGRVFWMWKLRTMWSAASPSGLERAWPERIEAEPARPVKLPRDARVTSRFAAFCRRHSIDELPQLLHVMRGEMSLVGPRPVTQGELAHYGESAARILQVKPGLTGYWQTQGRSRLSYQERVTLDLELIREMSARVYFTTLLRTIPEVLSGQNAR